MTAGLQGYIGRRTLRQRTGLCQSIDLRMALTGALMKTLADHLIAANQHATNTWIGLGGIQPLFGELQGSRHVAIVGSSESHQRSAVSAEVTALIALGEADDASLSISA